MLPSWTLPPFAEPYLKRAHPDEVVLILKAREPVRIMIVIGNKQDTPLAPSNPPGVVQYNFYASEIQIICMNLLATLLDL